MNRRRFAIGPGAASLILILVILSMSTLGVLALMNARSDLAISRRSAEVAAEIYALNEQAERSLAALDDAAARCGAAHPDPKDFLTALAGALPQGMTLEGGTVTWEETLGIRTLSCGAALAAPGEGPRVRWVRHELWTELERMGVDASWN